MAYKCLSLCRFRGFIAGFCKNFIQRIQKFKVRFQGKAKNLDLFRMRKKFRVQVERNFRSDLPSKETTGKDLNFPIKVFPGCFLRR